MKKTLCNLLFVVFLPAVLIQCVATEKEVKGVDLRLRTLDNRMVNIEREIGGSNGQTGEGTIEKIRKQQANLDDATDRLKTELLQVKGQLEETSNIHRRLQKEDKNIRKEINSRYTELIEKITLLTEQLNSTVEELKEIKEARVREASERALAAARAAKEAKEKAEQQAVRREIIPTQSKKKIKADKEQTPTATDRFAKAYADEKAFYDKCLSLFKDKKYKEAYNAFSEYSKTYPQGKMAANARFWQGDCLYNQKDFELAILEYQKVIADFPNHPKAPAALLKQGMAFEKLNDAETAKIVYQKLLAEYPQSDQSAVAAKRIESLK